MMVAMSCLFYGSLPEREDLFGRAGEAGELAPRWAVQGDLLLAQVKAVPLYSILGEGSSISGLSNIVTVRPDPDSGSFFYKNEEIRILVLKLEMVLDLDPNLTCIMYCSGENRRISNAENPPKCPGGIREFYYASLFVSLFPTK
jgi:hypothetical protein